jgi:hypothetical protein
MKTYFINFLYWFFSILELFLLKIITHNYHIDNIIFNSTFRAITLPYYIYKIITHRSDKNSKISYAKWYDVSIGVLDQLDITLSYISLFGLIIGEYLTFRTLSIFFAGLYSIIYYKKFLTMQKSVSILFILISSLILLLFSGSTSIFYSLICISTAIIYSSITLIIEINIKNKEDLLLNLYWSKTFSYLMALFAGLISEYSYKSISSVLLNLDAKNMSIVILLEIFIAVLENYYYYYKLKVVSQYDKNGSIIVQYIDIIRRFCLIVIGALFFKEIYTSVFYISATLMFIGSMFGLINLESLNIFYKKYFTKEEKIIVDSETINVMTI